MTTCLLPARGWGSLVIGLDWDTTTIVGWELALRRAYRQAGSRRPEWEAALAQAVQAEFPNGLPAGRHGVRGAGLKLVSDLPAAHGLAQAGNGSHPPATGFMAAMGTLGIKPVFTSSDHPKGTAETERLMRTIKAERLCPRQFTGREEARMAIHHGITVEDHERDVHSSLGYKSPLDFEAALRPQEAAQPAA